MAGIRKIPGHLLSSLALCHLEFPEIRRLAACSRYHRSLLDDEKVWEALYRRDLSDAKEDGRYLRTEENYRKAYLAELQSTDWLSAAEKGYEKLLRRASHPLSSGRVVLRAAEHGHVDIVERWADRCFLDVLLEALYAITKLGRKDAVERVRRVCLLYGGTEQTASETILLSAAEHGHLDLLEFGIPASEAALGLAIDRAVQSGHVSILRRLFDCPRLASDCRWAMDKAIVFRQLAVTIFLREERKMGFSPHHLYLACQTGELACVRYVLEHLSSPLTCQQIREAFSRAVLVGGSPPIARYLLSFGNAADWPAATFGNATGIPGDWPAPTFGNATGMPGDWPAPTSGEIVDRETVLGTLRECVKAHKPGMIEVLLQLGDWTAAELQDVQRYCAGRESYRLLEQAISAR